jgi:hypothetical protein
MNFSNCWVVSRKGVKPGGNSTPSNCKIAIEGYQLKIKNYPIDQSALIQHDFLPHRLSLITKIKKDQQKAGLSK